MDNRENFKDLFEKIDVMKKAYQNNNESGNDSFDIDLNEIREAIFHDRKDINDVSNVFIKCKISRENAQKGIKQLVKYKCIDENGKKVERKELIKIPSGIETGSRIICYSEGNYIKEKGIYSNLILNIEVK